MFEIVNRQLQNFMSNNVQLVLFNLILILGNYFYYV